MDIKQEWFRPAASSENSTEDHPKIKPEGYWKSVLRNVWRKKSSAIVTAFILLLVVFAYIQPLLPAQKDPVRFYTDEMGTVLRNLKPCRDYWMGTDGQGRDIWSRLWLGCRISLALGVGVAFIRCLLGTVTGLVWGYFRKADAVFSEVYNVVSNIPSAIITCLISSMRHPGLIPMIIALTSTTWLGTARTLRNFVVHIRDNEYNQASICLGTPSRRIACKNLIPNILPVLTIEITNAIPGAIGGEVFLAYLGLGFTSNVSLGNLISGSMGLLITPSLRYQFLFPAAVLSLITVCFYIAGLSFSQASDPKKGRSTK